MITWLFLSLTVAILLTPGPTNTLLASSGVQVGAAKSLKLIPAEIGGYLTAISLWGIMIGSVTTTVPMLIPVIKLLSAAYILFLALRLWVTSTRESELGKATVTPLALFFATLLNPKALLFASAVFPAAAWKAPNVYLAHIATFIALAAPIALAWIAIGSALTSRKIAWLNQRNLQRAACFVLICFSVPIGYSGIVSF